MRKIQLFIILVLACVLASCHRKPVYPTVLLRADSLSMHGQARQAMQLLDSIGPDMQEAREPWRRYHQLLTIKAQDKAYIPQTSDSLMLTLVDYYEHRGDKSLLPEAFYYLGSTYRDLNDVPRALKYYQKALDVMQGDKHLKMKTKVYAQMGEMFLYQDLYDDALACLNQSYHCDILLNDTSGMIYNLMDIANVYRYKEKIDSAIIYFEKTATLSERYNDDLLKNIAFSQISSLQIKLENYDSAKALLQPALSNLDSTNISSIYSIAANLYFKIDRLDSAVYYNKELLKVGNLYAKTKALYSLAAIALKKGKVSESLTYINEYQQWNDSLQKVTSTETVAKMHSLYNYQHIERENNALRLHRKNIHIYLLMFIFSTLLLLAVSIILYLSNKWRKLHFEMEIERINRLKDEISIKSHKETEELQEKINALIVRLQSAKKVTENLNIENLRHSENYQELKAEMDVLINEKQTIEHRLLMNMTLDEQITPSSVHKFLKGKAQNEESMSETDWTIVEKVLAKYNHDFTKRLIEKAELNQTELKICQLLKLQMSPSAIAVLISRSYSDVSMSRKRLYKKFTGKDGSTKNLDDLINSF